MLKVWNLRVQRSTNLKNRCLVTAGIFWSVAGYSIEPNLEKPIDKLSVSYFTPTSNASNFLLPIPNVSMQVGGKTIISFLNFAPQFQQEKLDKKFAEILKGAYTELNIKYDFKEKQAEIKHFEMPDNLSRVSLYDQKIEDKIVNDGEEYSRTIHWSNK